MDVSFPGLGQSTQRLLRGFLLRGLKVNLIEWPQGLVDRRLVGRTVWVVDAWDGVEGESYISLWDSRQAAQADLKKWFDLRGWQDGDDADERGLYGGVVKRKVRA